MVVFQLLATLVFVAIGYYLIKEILEGKWDESSKGAGI